MNDINSIYYKREGGDLGLSHTLLHTGAGGPFVVKTSFFYYYEAIF